MRSIPVMAFAVLAVGCAHRDSPYRFRGPVVSSVHVGELRSSGSAAPGAMVARERGRIPDPVPVYDDVTPAGPAPADPYGQGHDDELRALVGQRLKQASQMDFVRTALAAMGAPVGGDVREAGDGPQLVALADARGALARDATPLRGDVLVFDDVIPQQAASCLGVVVAVDGRGVVEFVYLARGIVRRGFMHTGRATEKRDDGGRVLNTILRQEHGGRNKGLGDLAGQLYSAYVRLERLLVP